MIRCIVILVNLFLYVKVTKFLNVISGVAFDPCVSYWIYESSLYVSLISSLSLDPAAGVIRVLTLLKFTSCLRLVFLLFSLFDETKLLC